MGFKGKRIVIGKLGLDGHDTGMKIVARWLFEAGYEVLYAGLYNSPQRIVQMAIEEAADAIGISSLEFEHLYYANKLLEELRAKSLDDRIKVIFGGVIPQDDVQKLKQLGVNAVFTPGTRKDILIQAINDLFASTF